MTFVDTNYFVRFLIKDDKKQYGEVENLFKAGSEGKIELFTSTIVLFEIYWVLSSFYEKGKPEVSSVLTKILNLAFIDIEERDILISAVNLFLKTNLDLEDSYNLAYAKNKKANIFATFDDKLLKEFNKE